ncbi:MAG: arsenate reductase ArsC [Candidatus Omnitrophica bacterium]|nr:arsenate reductase ArsC [Candidatus Omnitrophota bacterium]
MKKRVLFLCTGNSCRSQMAEGFLRSLAGERFEALSAGIKPASVNPLAVKVMQEAGVDISRQESKPVSLFLKQQFDFVITVCDNARQACPFFPGTYKAIHWDIEDPAAAQGSEEEKLTVFRKIRERIRERVASFIENESL